MLFTFIIGIVTPEAASKKWRYLKDSYMRIRNDIIKKKSGSAASKVIKWKWYEFMQFLHDTQDSRRLVYSNIVYVIEYLVNTNCSNINIISH